MYGLNSSTSREMTGSKAFFILYFTSSLFKISKHCEKKSVIYHSMKNFAICYCISFPYFM